MVLDAKRDNAIALVATIVDMGGKARKVLRGGNQQRMDLGWSVNKINKVSIFCSMENGVICAYLEINDKRGETFSQRNS